MRIVVHIPAREGSKRVPRKNIREMAGKPMIHYTIDSALNSGITEEVYLNTDSEELISYVSKFLPKCKIYRRPKELCLDNSTSDDFNHDIIKNLRPDILVMINPVCPLITKDDIRNALKKFETSQCDTLISCESTQMQTFCNNKPININIEEQLQPSQLNGKIQILNWAISIWNCATFLGNMNSKGYAVLGGKTEFFDLPKWRSVKVSEEEDFELAERLITSRV